jgi:hypothetical protein
MHCSVSLYICKYVCVGQVLGFGRTERSTLGEELFLVRLKLVGCERGAWLHCVCGVAAGRDPRGVCSGDSGGPVLYHGAQVRTLRIAMYSHLLSHWTLYSGCLLLPKVKR